jgi:hypothetical protein
LAAGNAAARSPEGIVERAKLEYSNCLSAENKLKRALNRAEATEMLNLSNVESFGGKCLRRSLLMVDIYRKVLSISMV